MMPADEHTCIYLKPILLYFISFACRISLYSLFRLVFKGCDTSVCVGFISATVVVVAYVAKCFYKKVVITNYYLITIRLIFN